jgi:hypothetical protein
LINIKQLAAPFSFAALQAGDKPEQRALQAKEQV